MIRTQIYLTKIEKIFFQKEAAKLGLAMADLIRRVLDEYIKEHRNENSKSL